MRLARGVEVILEDEHPHVTACEKVFGHEI
jgi:hypothetical protein